MKTPTPEQVEWALDTYSYHPDAPEILARRLHVIEIENARLRALVEPATWAVKLIEAHWSDDGRDACNLDGWCALKDALAALPNATVNEAKTP